VQITCTIFKMHLEKFPRVPKKTVVFRGIPDDNNIISTNYDNGRIIHWSAYSSSTIDISEAKTFATTNGVIMEITLIDSGKIISEFSPFPNEKEVLLSPNLEFIVQNKVNKRSDGYYYVELLQIRTNSTTFIF